MREKMIEIQSLRIFEGKREIRGIWGERERKKGYGSYFFVGFKFFRFGSVGGGERGMAVWVDLAKLHVTR